MPDETPKPSGEIVLYQTEDGQTLIQCRFENESVWMTQAQMAELFQTTVPNINLHLKNLFEEGELREEATIKEYLIVRQEGQRQVNRPVMHYIGKAVADKLAQNEYDCFHSRRLVLDAESDSKAFDQAFKALPAKKPRKKS
jgi:hypothetical protein